MERSDLFLHIKEVHVSSEEYLNLLEQFAVLVPDQWSCRHCQKTVVKEHMILDHACKRSGMIPPNYQAWKLSR